MTIFTSQIDNDGIATICWNDEQAPVNALNSAAIDRLTEVVDEVIQRQDLIGIILTSGKSDFVVGADLKQFLVMENDPQAVVSMLSSFHTALRKLETCGKPVVAAMNGSALGGGLEYALASHYRLAAENKAARFGFPEASLGLLPGGGGTQRYGRMVGAEGAFKVLTEARTYKLAQAVELKMVDRVVAEGDLLSAAKQWIQENPEVAQPWDVKGFRLPGGKISHPKVQQLFTVGQAVLNQKTYGNYPAQQNILQALYEGLQLPIEAALKVEVNYFVELMMSKQARAMIRSFFMSLQELNKLKRRPKGFERQSYQTVGVLGAGMMGAGIAYSSALAGINVVLVDTDQANAEKGKAYSEKLLNKKVAKGHMPEEKARGILERIIPTTDFAMLKDCELVIEAVFESREIKADVTQKTEAVVPETATFASNTSTLPITGLATASKRPEQFIGLHFFSPVDKMKLVEVIMGEKTSQETLAKSLDFIQQINKTPIVVNDSRGFYTSRVFKTYVLEGVALLQEGVNPALIENAAKMAGMPIGPLALLDEVSLELVERIVSQTKKDLGEDYVGHPAEPAIEKMVNEFKRVGKKTGQGFYDYSGKSKQLWSGLADAFPAADEQPDVALVQQRLLHIQAIETVRCMEEEVLTTPQEADIGSIFGWGFAPHTGGVISYIEGIGLNEFTDQCDNLSESFGVRFKAPKLLRSKASNEERFYR